MSNAATPAPRTRRSRGPAVFRLGALTNWLVTVPAVAMPELAAEVLRIESLANPWLLRIWAGMAFLWGVMFWEISRDLDGRQAMIKYAWMEKSITAVSVTLFYPPTQGLHPVFLMILVTDYVWIPLFLYYHVRTRGNPTPASALARARQSLGLEASKRGQPA
jgi:hypothetical protein